MLYSFSLNEPSGQKVIRNLKNRQHTKIIESNISVVTLYFEDDKNRKVELNGETIAFALQRRKIQV